MFGFTDQDSINSWLDGRKEGRPMAIDCPSVRETLRKEIESVKKTSQERIKNLEDLLTDGKYFK